MASKRITPKYPELVPFQSVGKFNFGESIGIYKEAIKDFSLLEGYDDTYISPDDTLMVSFDEGYLNAIYSYEKLFYGQKNLIGMTVADFGRLMGCRYVGAVDSFDLDDEGGGLSYVYEFEDVGCEVWEVDGKITTIIASCREDYLDEWEWPPLEGVGEKKKQKKQKKHGRRGRSGGRKMT